MPLPLIPILWTVGTAVASAVVNRTRKTKLKIAVIGPEEGGKTAFINLLKNGTVKKDEPYRNTGLNEALLEFEAFWSVENSVLRTDIAVNSEAGLWEKIKDFVPGEQHGGKDIPGEKGLTSDYKKLLEGKDFSFFFFNIKRYFDEKKYQKDVNSRLDWLNYYVKPDDLIVVATHIDQMNENINDISRKFRDLVKGKDFGNVLKNVKYINLLDENAGEEMRKCFGKYGEH